MTLKQIAGLGRKLVMFLGLFVGCFGRREARELLRVYVQGQLSDVHRKTAEGIALEFGRAPRTLQRFLESISGMKRNSTTVANRLWPKIMVTRTRSAWWTSPGSPRVGMTRWASRGSGMATVARWTIAWWGCI